MKQAVRKVRPGRYGAKVQSWEFNPRAILASLIQRRPQAGIDELLREMIKRIKANEAMMTSVIQYWFANNYASLVEPRKLRLVHNTPAGRAARKIEVKALVQKVKATVLDTMVLSTGKTLGDSTGAECIREGGWLERLGGMVGPRQKIRDHLTAEQVLQARK